MSDHEPSCNKEMLAPGHAGESNGVAWPYGLGRVGRRRSCVTLATDLALRASRAFFLRLRSFFQRLVGLDPRPILTAELTRSRGKRRADPPAAVWIWKSRLAREPFFRARPLLLAQRPYEPYAGRVQL